MNIYKIWACGNVNSEYQSFVAMKKASTQLEAVKKLCKSLKIKKPALEFCNDGSIHVFTKDFSSTFYAFFS